MRLFLYWFIITNRTKFTFNIFQSFSQDNIANAKTKIIIGEYFIMAKNVVPEAKDALNRFKMEAANDLGIPFPS